MITPARKKVPYKPDAPACESLMAPGIHSLARRARIGFVRIFGAGVIRALCEILKGRREKSREESSRICPEAALKWAIPAHRELGTSLLDFCRDPANGSTKASRLDGKPAISQRDTSA
jgi:hypothetical protein